MKKNIKPDNTETEKKIGMIDFWRFVLRYLAKHKAKLAVAVICSITTGIVVAVQPLLIKNIVDEGIAGDWATKELAFRHVLIWVGVFVVISLYRILSWRLGYHCLLHSLEDSIYDLRSDVFACIQRQGMRFYERNSSGELYNYVLGSPIANIKGYLNTMFLNTPYQVIAFIISIAALATYNWVLTAVMVVISLLMTLATFLSRKIVRSASNDYLSSEKQTSKYMTDIFNGIDAVKMYSIEEDVSKTISRQLTEYKDKGLKLSFRNIIAIQRPEFIRYLGTAVIYVVGAVCCIWGENLPGGKLTTGEFYAFRSSMTSILEILNNWFSLSFSRAAAESALEKIVDVMEEEIATPEVDSEHRHIVHRDAAAARSAGKPCVEFDHIDFSYDSRPIFTDFSCSVGYGESIGLVGESGSGKSTFTKLIMRLYDVSKGEIKVHGTDVRMFPTHNLRASFGIVPQNPFIFYGSILDNIKITRPGASDEEVKNAMDIARVTDFLPDMPNGVDTIIGNGAMSLSGGQKQRVAIARAILKKPQVLIFDEATSALDNRSEHLIQLAIGELMKDHTVIIVAHRLSTIKNVDRILVFHDGEIV
ncbi:MAG: ABC transporter ATP-binding protein/permease, partial [Clostridia bacterium]|nr:ABC transporter ATP-binding protein/permease [Clostridia bacterium]